MGEIRGALFQRAIQYLCVRRVELFAVEGREFHPSFAFLATETLQPTLEGSVINRPVSYRSEIRPDGG